MTMGRFLLAAMLVFAAFLLAGCAERRDIFELIQYGGPNEIRRGLKMGADVNARESHGWTPLISAARDHDRESIALLLEAGAEVNAQDEDGDTALITAAMSNDDPEVIGLLLAAGADVSLKDNGGCTALDFAESNPRIKGTPACAALETALKKAYSRSMDLCEIVRFGSTQQVQAAMKKGADVNAPDFSGDTPLLYALRYERDDSFIAFLLKSGADVNAHGQKGSTLLIGAAGHRNLEAIASFIDAGADVNASDNLGYTPLMSSVFNEDPRVQALLLDAGADPMAKNALGQTAFDIAGQLSKTIDGDASRRLRESAAGNP
jgi:uncharacterized protein